MAIGLRVRMLIVSGHGFWDALGVHGKNHLATRMLWPDLPKRHVKAPVVVLDMCHGAWAFEHLRHALPKESTVVAFSATIYMRQCEHVIVQLIEQVTGDIPEGSLAACMHAAAVAIGAGERSPGDWTIVHTMSNADGSITPPRRLLAERRDYYVARSETGDLDPASSADHVDASSAHTHGGVVVDRVGLQP